MRHLRRHGCHLKREGGSHSLWTNPQTGAVEAVPRHSEAVRADAQRRGIGKALMAAAEEFARTHDCERLEVVTSDRRLGAHAFYDRLGYKHVAKRFVKYSPTGPVT